MKRKMLPLGALLFIIACGDDSSSAFDAWSEIRSSSSEPAEESSSSSVTVSSSSESFSSSSKVVSSSSAELSSSSAELSSSSVARSSSSRNNAKSSSSSVFENSSSSRKGVNSSSSSEPAEESSSSSVAVSSSSETFSSSSKVVSSSSAELSSSSAEISSSSVELSSSSEILTDPSKIFEIRKPKHDAFTCEVSWGDETETKTFSQHDVICTYDYNGEQGFLYVRLTPTSCHGGMSITPSSYDVDKVELYVNGEFAEVSDVKYEWGGNHHVEKLMFTYKDKVFRYGQSTMGWGGRPCQNMDCLKVFESDGKTYVENGCNERSLPIVCRNVNGNGEIVGDFTDKYEVCEGDPRTLGYEVEY